MDSQCSSTLYRGTYCVWDILGKFWICDGRHHCHVDSKHVGEATTFCTDASNNYRNVWIVHLDPQCRYASSR